MFASAAGCLDTGESTRLSDGLPLAFEATSQTATWDDLSARFADSVRLRGCGTVRVTDLDGDGALDVVAPHEEGALDVFRVGRDGRIAPAPTVIGASEEQLRSRQAGGWCPLLLQDLDGDGSLEAVVRHATGARVLWLDGLTVQREEVLACAETLVTDVALWVSPAGRRYVVAAGEARAWPEVNVTEDRFGVIDEGRRPVIRLDRFPEAPVCAWRVEAPRRVTPVTVRGPARCMAQGSASTPEQVLLACDFARQVAVREQGDGLVARAFEGSFAHGMGVTPWEFEARRPLYAISSLGAFVALNDDRAITSLGPFPAVVWGAGTMDLNGDAVPDLVAPPNGVSTDDLASFRTQTGRSWAYRLYRALFFEGGVPQTAAWGLVSVRRGARVSMRPLEVSMRDANGRPFGFTKDVTVADLDRDGRVEMIFTELDARDPSPNGRVRVGRPRLAGPAPEAHFLTVLPGRAAPFTEVSVECEDASTHARRVFPSVERGGNASVLQFTCPTARYRRLTVTSGGRTFEHGPGAMDRSLTLARDASTAPLAA